MFKTIRINHFRGIQEMKIENLKQFNLIVGQNNSSKTALLEAIFLLIGASNADLPNRINKMRNLITRTENYWQILFHNLDTEQSINIEGTWTEQNGREKQARSLKIKPYNPSPEGGILEKPLEKTTNLSQLPSSTVVETRPKGLQLDFQYQQNQVSPLTTFVYFPEIKDDISPGKLKIKLPPNDYTERIAGIIINPITLLNYEEQANHFSDLKRQKRISEIVNVLKKIEPNLQDLSLNENQMLECDIEGLSELVPLNILGDGITKILSILLTIPSAKDGILLIDEIENGLHYSALTSLWNEVFDIARKYHVQIFATTHSIECVRAFANSASEHLDDINLYRIERRNDQHHIVTIPGALLSNAIEANVELR